MSRKETPTEYDIHPLIRDRWSPRSFSDKPITEKELHQIIEAGRWAPSSYNMQPWRIIYALEGSETYDRIMSCLVEFNQSWVKNASALMLGCYKKTKPDGSENFHALHDLGLFMGMASIQAESMDIGVHQMAGLDYEKARKEFGFSEEYHVATAVTFGYYGGDSKTQLSEDLHAQEGKDRERKLQNEFAFNGDFKETE